MERAPQCPHLRLTPWTCPRETTNGHVPHQAMLCAALAPLIPMRPRGWWALRYWWCSPIISSRHDPVYFRTSKARRWGGDASKAFPILCYSTYIQYHCASSGMESGMWQAHVWGPCSISSGGPIGVRLAKGDGSVVEVGESELAGGKGRRGCLGSVGGMGCLRCDEMRYPT